MVLDQPRHSQRGLQGRYRIQKEVIADPQRDAILRQHLQMTWTYERAENGNVALTGEVDLGFGSGEFVLALAFGRNPAEAGHRARASLLDGFAQARAEYIRLWQQWQSSLLPLGDGRPENRDLYRLSAMVLQVHAEKHLPGGIIASLSIPWGFAKSDDDLGGYHLAWPRDLVEAAGGLLAAGLRDDTRRVLNYLHTTQEADGRWLQNMRLDGTPYWNGVQMDETALRAPATVHWSADGWQTIHDTPTRDTTLGVHLVDLPTAELPQGRLVCFTFFWPASRQWEGADFTVAIE